MSIDTPKKETRTLRILAASTLWQGGNDYAFVRAFRRMGHSVRAINEHEFLPPWKNLTLRVLKRIIHSELVKEYNRALLREADLIRPDMFFVFKGAFIEAATLRAIRSLGTVCIQFYPDTGFRAHSKQLWGAIPEYDWFFSTKPNHPEELSISHNYHRVSYLPHGFDLETHRIVETSRDDVSKYSCDVSFIGNPSRKKSAVLESLLRTTNGLKINIWGAQAWQRESGLLARAYRGAPIYGTEYAKAIRLAKINLGLLFEGNSDGAAPDQLTARTFEIPAAGGFMLHERTPEAEEYFDDGVHCGFFDDPHELTTKIKYYLSHEVERTRICEAGNRHCMEAGYSTDDRARAVLDKYQEILASRMCN